MARSTKNIAGGRTLARGEFLADLMEVVAAAVTHPEAAITAAWRDVVAGCESALRRDELPAYRVLSPSATPRPGARLCCAAGGCPTQGAT